MKNIFKKQEQSKQHELKLDSSKINIILSVIIMLISLLTLKLVAEQTRYARIQSAPERIKQAQSIQRALEYCEQNPKSDKSGLQNTDTGENAPCSEILKLK